MVSQSGDSPTLVAIINAINVVVSSLRNTAVTLSFRINSATIVFNFIHFPSL